MKNLVVLCFLILSLYGFSGTRFEYEWTGFDRPQAICEYGQQLFVSNLGEEGKSASGGYISRLTKKGEIIDKYWVSGLKAPRGLNVINHRLYVADCNFVRGYDLISRKEVFSLELPSTQRLMDVENLRDGVSFAVSDGENGLIYRVYFNGDYYSLILEPITNITGLYFYKRKLYFCTGAQSNSEKSQVGYLKIQYSRNELIPYFLGSAKGDFRGIAVKGDSVFVTDRRGETSGRVFCFDSDENLQYTIWDRGLFLPGDYLMTKDNIFVPNEKDGKIKYISDIH